MITQISGTLRSVETGRITLEVGAGMGLVLELLAPGYLLARLGGSIDRRITLQTRVYLESVGQGSSFIPRLVGFPSEMDRSFYELLVTVKGIGQRKALRAMTLPANQIAGAIADRDVKLLQTLPEIGKRTAETIVVELKDKVTPWLGAAETVQSLHQGGDLSGGGNQDSDGVPSSDADGRLVRDALQTLTALGEPPAAASQWIETVLSGDDPPAAVGELVQAAFRLKSRS